jgi:hypothetical protein
MTSNRVGWAIALTMAARDEALDFSLDMRFAIHGLPIFGIYAK